MHQLRLISVATSCTRRLITLLNGALSTTKLSTIITTSGTTFRTTWTSTSSIRHTKCFITTNWSRRNKPSNTKNTLSHLILFVVVAGMASVIGLPTTFTSPITIRELSILCCGCMATCYSWKIKKFSSITLCALSDRFRDLTARASRYDQCTCIASTTIVRILPLIGTTAGCTW